MSNIQKREDIVLFIYQRVIGFIPGGNIINGLIDLRGHIQQNRLNRFSEFLKEGFENNTGKEFDEENLKTEDFIDAFDAILRKVASTKSEEKLKRYANVLLHKIFEKDDYEMFFKYLTLVEDLSETQVLILQKMHEYKQQRSVKHINTELGIFHMIIDENVPENLSLDDELRKKPITLYSGNQLNYEEVLFCIKDLTSKALLSMRSVRQMLNEIEVYEITAVGNGFLEFIKEYGSEN